MIEPSADIQEGQHYCHACHKRTTWSGTKKQKCEDCLKVFPCMSKKCGHEDCDAHRAYYGVSAGHPTAESFDEPMFG